MNSRSDLQKMIFKSPLGEIWYRSEIQHLLERSLRSQDKTSPGWDPVRQGFLNPGPQTWLVSGLVGHRAGWWAKEPSFICICSHSPLLVLPPELPLLSDQQGVINAMHLNHPEASPSPGLWKNCLPPVPSAKKVGNCYS